MLRYLFFFILHAALLSPLSLAEAEKNFLADIPSNENCSECHQKVYEEVSAYPLKHSAFVLSNCSMCHIINGRNANSSGRKYSKRRSYSNKPPAVKWNRVLLTNYAAKHLVVLGNLNSRDEYLVKIGLRDRKGRKNESGMISFTPASISELWVDDETPPVISGVEVKSVIISVFTGAEIAWETGELSDSRVEYGETKDKDYEEFSYSSIYRRRHNIKLNALVHKKKYRFRVISTDPFGNRAVSGEYIFDISEAFNNQEPDVKNNGKKDSKPEFKSIDILKLKEKKQDRKVRVAVFVNASTDVTSFVEYRKNEKKKKVKESENEKASEEKKHGEMGLMSRREAGIDPCIDCHRQGASHSVGMPGKGNITIPGDLPTGEGNVITCVTCHTPHGGKLRYLARFDFGRNMCVMCHKTY